MGWIDSKMRKVSQLGVAGLMAVLAAGCAEGIRSAGGPAPPERPVTLLVLGDLKGSLEPCGCTSDPKGGIYRLGTVVRDARARAAGTALFGAGDLLYDDEVAAPTAAQDEARAEILALALSRI